MKHRRKANVRSRDSGTARMWTASESTDGARTQVREKFDSIEQIESEPADFQTIDSVAEHDAKVGGRYTRARRQQYDKAVVNEARRQRRGFLGLPGSLWLTGIIVLGGLGAFWVSGDDELKEKYGLNFIGGDGKESTVADSTTQDQVTQESVAETPAQDGDADNVSSSEVADTVAEADADADDTVAKADADDTVAKADADDTVVKAEADDTVAKAEVDDTVAEAEADDTVAEAEAGDTVAEAEAGDTVAEAEATGDSQLSTESEPVTKEQLAAAAAALNEDDARAETLYQALLEQEPDNAEAVGGLAILRERALTDMAEMIDQNTLTDAKENVDNLSDSLKEQKREEIKAQIDELNSMSEDIDTQIEQARQQQPPWWIAEGARRAADGNLVSAEGAAAADAYRMALELDPDSVQAIEGLRSVRQQLLESAQTAVDEKRIEDARSAIEQARDVSATDEDLAEVDALLAKLSTENDTRIAELIERAEGLVEQDRLIGDNSAINALNEAMVLDPTNQDVSLHREALVPRLLDKANQAATDKDWETAIEHVDTAALLDPENAEIKQLSTEINSQAENWVATQKRLVTAQYRLERDIILGADGAIAVYSELLQADSENEQAKSGLDQAAERLQVLAAKDILNERVEFARAKLEAAQALRPDDASLQEQLARLSPEGFDTELAQSDSSPAAADEDLVIVHSDPDGAALLEDASSERPITGIDPAKVEAIAKQAAEAEHENDKAPEVVAKAQTDADNAPDAVPVNSGESTAPNESVAAAEEAMPVTSQSDSSELAQQDAAATVEEPEVIETASLPAQDEQTSVSEPVADTSPTPVAAQPQVDGDTTTHCANDYDCIGMVIDSGDPVLVQMGKEMSKMVTGSAGGTVVKPTEGPIANTVKLLSKENAGLSVVPSDMLSYAERSQLPELEAASRRLRFIMTIGQKTVYLVARKTISSVADLDARRVVMGPSNTAIWVVSNNILHLNGVTPSEKIEQKPAEGLLALITNEVDAVFVVGPNPHPLLQNLVKMRESEAYSDYADQIHILPLIKPTDTTEYVADSVTYPGIADNVETLAILPTLVSYDFSHKQTPYFQRRCDELAKVGSTVTGRLKELQQTGHKQWKATSWKMEAGPWKKDACFFRDVDQVAQTSQKPVAQ